MPLRRAVLTRALSFLVLLSAASAEENAGTYTPEGIAALVRALHAVH